MRQATAATLAAIAALAGTAGLGQDGYDLAECVRPVNAEALQWATAEGAGREALAPIIRTVPKALETGKLEVIHKGRVPKQAKVFIGSFGGRECLAWLGSAERMVAGINGMPDVLDVVKVVFIKVIRPTRADRESYRLAAAPLVVEG